MTVELTHEPGEELQLDWLELAETPWGEPAHVLVGALSHSGRIRALFSEGESFAEAASHLFQVVSRRYEHGTIILTTNRGIAAWGEIFDDTTVAAAILDRLLHHGIVLTINGPSYRMRRHQERLETLRDGLLAGPPAD